MEDASREQERGKNLALYKSVFGTRYMVCGNMRGDEPYQGTPLNQSTIQM
jgi:hypothetical protein